MNSLAALVITLITLSLFAPPIAEAKRLGGGGNMGKQYNMPHSAPAQQTRPVSPANMPAAPASMPRTTGASRWLGPLAGLAAGGLLASLFFGDAFEGLQVMDFLLIIAVILGGFLMFRLMRRGSGPIPAPAGTGQPHGGRSAFPHTSGRTPPPKASSVSPSADSGSSTLQAPAWFDVQGFVAGAKSHFLRLQSSWDKADFNDIRGYTTPELFNELERERLNLGSKPQFTEVVTLNVALAAVRREGSQVVVSLEFSGLIREETSDTAQPFREIWHINHEWESAAGDWFVAGIQQVES